jgi:type I restriction enzyme S subunit
MTKLKKYRFSDLYVMSSGISSTKEQAGHGSPFLSFSTVFNNHFVPETLGDLMDTSEREQSIFSVQSGDIFLTRTSEVVDELAMSSVALKDYPKATFSGFLKRLRPIKLNITYPKYMAFYLRSPLFRKTMTNNAVMTLRASLNEAIFSYIDLLLPEYDEQVKAGDLLYLLSQKIELNNRINAELEAMAKTLYDYWFVQFDFPFDFAQGKPDTNGKPYKSSGGRMVYNPTLKREIPDGWKVRKLEQIATVVRGASPRPIDDYLSDSGLPWIKISDATTSENRFVLKTKQFIKEEGKSATRVLPSNKLILSNSATPGIPRITKIESGIHDGWLYIDDFKHGFSMEILYQFFLNERPRILNLGNGSIFKNLKTDYIKSISLVSPPEIVLKKASAVLTKISDLLYTNSRETKELEELRDWLLPMLMNGQVTVKSAME